VHQAHRAVTIIEERPPLREGKVFVDYGERAAISENLEAAYIALNQAFRGIWIEKASARGDQRKERVKPGGQVGVHVGGNVGPRCCPGHGGARTRGPAARWTVLTRGGSLRIGSANLLDGRRWHNHWPPTSASPAALAQTTRP
jgi:hypothetical protein